MSPSTITPSTGPPASDFAHACAPAKPCWEPEVDTSTIVLSSSRDFSTRANSSSTAVPERFASPGPSRLAMTTIRRVENPARVATTLIRSRSRATTTSRRTVNAARSPRSSGASKTCWTSCARAASPGEPAVRSGNAAAIPCSDCGSGVPEPKARSALKTSVGNALRAGVGRSASANAATNSATSAGRKAVRYTRASSTSVEVNA